MLQLRSRFRLVCLIGLLGLTCWAVTHLIGAQQIDTARPATNSHERCLTSLGVDLTSVSMPSSLTRLESAAHVDSLYICGALGSASAGIRLIGDPLQRAISRLSQPDATPDACLPVGRKETLVIASLTSGKFLKVRVPADGCGVRLLSLL
jgi:hypothetical protein